MKVNIIKAIKQYRLKLICRCMGGHQSGVGVNVGPENKVVATANWRTGEVSSHLYRSESFDITCSRCGDVYQLNDIQGRNVKSEKVDIPACWYEERLSGRHFHKSSANEESVDNYICEKHLRPLFIENGLVIDKCQECVNVDKDCAERAEKVKVKS